MSVVWPHDGLLNPQGKDGTCTHLGSQQDMWVHDGYTDLQQRGLGDGGLRGRARHQRGEHAGGQAQHNSSLQQYRGG